MIVPQTREYGSFMSIVDSSSEVIVAPDLVFRWVSTYVRG